MYKISKNRALNIWGLEYENFIHKLAEGEGSTMTFAQTSYDEWTFSIKRLFN